MKYEKLKDGSYIHNCFIKRRENEKSSILFYQDGDESISAFLNGYAVIPLDEYFRLTDERGDDGNNWPDEMLKQIEEADYQLQLNEE